MNDRVLRAVTTGVANLAAVGLGALTALGSRWPWWGALPAGALGGTIGWLLGSGLGALLTRWARRHRTARPGATVHRLSTLPLADAAAAGGKARALARLSQAGLPVPPGVVVMPSGFTGSTLTTQARAALAKEVTRLQRAGATRFAVRSSAASEDSDTVSFAGQFATELDVSPADLIPAITRVRESGISERVLSYTAELSHDTSHELAVVVQVMVAAEQAGVLFTVHPHTADLSCMLGNVVTGLGESLVDGSADADQFTLTRPTGTYSGPASLRPHATRLHALAHESEMVLGGDPQDIEWALAAGRIWLLQSRPVTTLSGWDASVTSRNDSLRGACLWTATNLGEASPHPQTPLTMSSASYKQANGGPSVTIRGREMAGFIGGRPYANLSVQVSARGKQAVADPRGALRDLAAVWGEVPDWVPVPLIPLTSADWRREGLRLLRTLLQFARRRFQVKDFLATNRQRCQQSSAAIAATTTPAALLRLWHEELFPASLTAFWSVITVTSHHPAQLERELARRFGSDEASALMSNLAGLAGGLASLGPAQGLRQVAAGTLSRESYLAEFGHRGENETELAWVAPLEDPTRLDNLLAALSDTSPEQNPAVPHQDAMKRLARSDPRLARRFTSQLHKAAAQASLRERVRSESVRWTGVERRFALRAGEFLRIGDGVFFLTLPELLNSLAGDPVDTGRITARREHHARLVALPALPGIIVGGFDPFSWAAEQDRSPVFIATDPTLSSAPALSDPDLITGFAGAVGVVEGIVRRVERAEDADQVRPGEILLTRLTNIGWTPYFRRAAAIVTDLGAPLSHAAIVAREFGIPAVVGCGDATSRLSTGDLVRVNGGLGRVEILARCGAPASPGTTP